MTDWAKTASIVTPVSMVLVGVIVLGIIVAIVVMW